MRMLIVVGDCTTGGGNVITGTSQTNIEGKPVARVGDRATCPRHKGIFPIVSGDHTLLIDGQPVARHGDSLACGCTLLSGKQRLAFIENAAAAGSGAANPAVFAVHTPPTPPPDITSAVCEECLLAAAQKGTAFLGR
ncbi:PAAR domain-containing protein [Stenotrophomonas sp. Iso1]|uniref:PAAR domain-containing protein n=1 Tax=Stenotrophomonas sp. Iso1 TaxID=2977283 RepID=UPI0022B7B559|nr:PAAR domain-containing protein [Stenotrophomonas sp. Iso1]